ncbi:MAG: uracil-DNA glycosylase [Eubacteriales bacterium]
MNIKTYLTEIVAQNSLNADFLQFPDCDIDPAKIKVIMINEVVPRNQEDWFYSETPDPENMRTALGLFAGAGVPVKNIRDILDLGIYITAALKTPKESYTATPDVIRAQLPLLEAELAMFPNLKVIMLMGDVAKKAFNMITKARTNKYVIPSKPTGYIRMNEYYWNGIRVFPTYIMTGKNLLIEKGKCGTISDDIRRMMEVIQNV